MNMFRRQTKLYIIHQTRMHHATKHFSISNLKFHTCSQTLRFSLRKFIKNCASTEHQISFSVVHRVHIRYKLISGKTFEVKCLMVGRDQDKLLHIRISSARYTFQQTSTNHCVIAWWLCRCKFIFKCCIVCVFWKWDYFRDVMLFVRRWVKIHTVTHPRLVVCITFYTCFIRSNVSRKWIRRVENYTLGDTSRISLVCSCLCF